MAAKFEADECPDHETRAQTQDNPGASPEEKRERSLRRADNDSEHVSRPESLLDRHPYFQHEPDSVSQLTGASSLDTPNGYDTSESHKNQTQVEFLKTGEPQSIRDGAAKGTLSGLLDWQLDPDKLLPVLEGRNGQGQVLRVYRGGRPWEKVSHPHDRRDAVQLAVPQRL